jgi:hypothetical protein
MLGVTAAFTPMRDVADAEWDGFRVGYVAEDCMRRRVPPADAWAVLFETMVLSRQARAPAARLSCSDGLATADRVIAMIAAVDRGGALLSRSAWPVAKTGLRP